MSASIAGSYLSKTVSAVGKYEAKPGDFIFVSAIKKGSSILVAGSKRANIVSTIDLIAVEAVSLV